MCEDIQNSPKDSYLKEISKKYHPEDNNNEEESRPFTLRFWAMEKLIMAHEVIVEVNGKNEAEALRELRGIIDDLDTDVDFEDLLSQLPEDGRLKVIRYNSDSADPADEIDEIEIDPEEYKENCND